MLGHFPTLINLAGKFSKLTLARRSREGIDLLSGPRSQLRQRHDSRSACNLAAVVHEHQRRDALDGKALQEFARRIGIDLYQSHLRFEFACRLREDRRHGPAGAAPSRPEIHQQRNVTKRCMPIETGSAVQCDWLPFEKGFVARSAFASVRQALARDTVDRVAVRADDIQHRSHGYTDALRAMRTKVGLM